MGTMGRQYVIIRQHGYRIDVRGIFPLLVKGQTARSFETFQDALDYALSVIFPY